MPGRRQQNGGGHTAPPKSRTTGVVRRDGRADGTRCRDRRAGDPSGPGPSGPPTLPCARWEAITSYFAGHVIAVGYDADSGRLSVCPESAAWATKLRLEPARVDEAANESAGRTVVRGLQAVPASTCPAGWRTHTASAALSAPRRLSGWRRPWCGLRFEAPTRGSSRPLRHLEQET
ncbi:DciA family protein [Streptomyces bobili]|uniref:DciA family protein n=1 Tax=Streptomyces bobili TaxID=67280 RepID=UPI003793E632